MRTRKIHYADHISAPFSCRHDAVQVVVEAAQNVFDRPRAIVQLRCPETLLSSLVQASRQQWLGDTPLIFHLGARQGEELARSSSSTREHRSPARKRKKRMWMVFMCVLPGRLQVFLQASGLLSADQLCYKTPHNGIIII